MIAARCIILLFVASSCSYFRPDAVPEAVARVNESYLYKDDLAGAVPSDATKEDSIMITGSFIDRWAMQKLLIDAAEVNLPDQRKAEFDQLVAQYRNDLYTKAYIEEVVKRTVDTVVTDNEIRSYYEANKHNFKTNGDLVRLRYVLIAKDNPKFAVIKSKFNDFRKSDGKFWEANALHFKSASLNDSIWIDMKQLYSRLPFITPDNRDQYIVAGKAIQHTVGADVFLVRITKVLGRNQQSPLDYVKTTLRELIINKRKLELIKKFEKEITDDAIKNKKYEIYK